MQTSNQPHTTTGTAAGRRFTLCTLLFTILTPVTSTAQEPAAADTPLVPDNVAPHPAPAQPLPFSHKVHMASGLACQVCHVNPDPGNQMTFPATATCMTCHSSIATDKPAIVSLQEFADSGEQIPWVRVYAITSGVKWSHRSHLDAGTQCETCHGDIRHADAVAESKAVLAMASCIDCHRARQAPAECITCHAWPSDQSTGSK